MVAITRRTRPTGCRRLAGVAVASGAVAAGLLVAAFAGAAFGLQAIALPRPSAAQLTAAKTLRWLTHQQAIESVGPGRDGTVSTLCVDASALVGTPARRLRASLLITRDGQWIDTRAGSYRLGRTATELDGPWIELAAARAGCPTALERRIGRFLDLRTPVSANRVQRRRATLVLLRFRGPKRDLSLLVSPTTFAPVAVRLGRPGGSWRYLSPAEQADFTAPTRRLASSARPAT